MVRIITVSEVVSGPEPCTLAEVQAWAMVGADPMADQLITAARERAEEHTGCRFVQRTVVVAVLEYASGQGFDLAANETVNLIEIEDEGGRTALAPSDWVYDSVLLTLAPATAWPAGRLFITTVVEPVLPHSALLGIKDIAGAYIGGRAESGDMPMSARLRLASLRGL